MGTADSILTTSDRPESGDYGRRFDRRYSALVTPYLPGDPDTIDEDALRGLLGFHLSPEAIAAGIAVIINPEAGELFYLEREELRRNVEIAVEEAAGRVPVFAGVQGATTKETARQAVDAVKAGADGLFLLPPAGCIDISVAWDPIKYPEVWRDVMVRVLDATGDVPIITHPITGGSYGMFGISLPAEAAARLCDEIPQIVGWKMTYPYEGARAVAQSLRSLDRHVGVFSANGATFHEYLASDMFDGTVSGCFNYGLEPMLEHIRRWHDGDIGAANELWHGGLLDLQNYIVADLRLHIKYKVATWLRGIIASPTMRSPMPPPRRVEVETLRTLLERLGLDLIPLGQQQRYVETLPL